MTLERSTTRFPKAITRVLGKIFRTRRATPVFQSQSPRIKHIRKKVKKNQRQAEGLRATHLQQVTAAEIVQIREKLGVSRPGFAEMIRTSRRTIER